jgi:hypothetical protein
VDIGEQKVKRGSARSIWKREEAEKITERIRIMAKDNTVQRGSKKYFKFYQKAQSQLWEELSEDEQEKWTSQAFAERTRPKTKEEKIT